MTTQTPAPKKTTKFGKGNPGKPKGATNHMTRELKDMILGALDQAGGMEYLARQADEKPAAFLALVGKVLPLQVNGALEHSGGITVNIKQF